MGLRVLIVDDAGFIRQILAGLLVDLGCEVVGEARNGTEAVERAALLKPDLIFMDMVLPVKNGAEACQEILDANPTCQVIAMSTATEDVVRAKAEAAGCAHFLVKPFNKEALKNLLQKFGGSTRLNRAEGE